MYDAEKQKLRELAWFLLPQIKCYFCHDWLSGTISQIAFTGGAISFGHRRHTKVSALFTIHHLDEDRENNRPSNLVLAHSRCHKEHHAKKRAEQTEQAGVNSSVQSIVRGLPLAGESNGKE